MVVKEVSESALTVGLVIFEDFESGGASLWRDQKIEWKMGGDMAVQACHLVALGNTNGKFEGKWMGPDLLSSLLLLTTGLEAGQPGLEFLSILVVCRMATRG